MDPITCPAYGWTAQDPPPVADQLPPVHRSSAGGLRGALDGGVEWVLRSAHLLDILDRVTGDPDALQTAASRWLEQAAATRSTSAALRGATASLARDWEGEASEAFAAFMHEYVSALDALTANLAATAQTLHQAAAAAGLAEDLVTGIVADAAEWAAAELAATAVADVLTFGLATVAGAVAESATLAAFAERAAGVCEEFAATLKELIAEFQELQRAREAIRAADGFRKLHALRETQKLLGKLPVLDHGYQHAKAVSYGLIATETGLPLDVGGAKGFGAVVARHVLEERDRIEAALR